MPGYLKSTLQFLISIRFIDSIEISPYKNQVWAKLHLLSWTNHLKLFWPSSFKFKSGPGQFFYTRNKYVFWQPNNKLNWEIDKDDFFLHGFAYFMCLVPARKILMETRSIWIFFRLSLPYLCSGYILIILFIIYFSNTLIRFIYNGSMNILYVLDLFKSFIWWQYNTHTWYIRGRSCGFSRFANYGKYVYGHKTRFKNNESTKPRFCYRLDQW